MFFLARPSSDTVARIVAACPRSAPNYTLLAAADLARPPRGFQLDDYGVVLGHGEVTWAAARAAMDARAMYPPEWASAHAAPGRLDVGATFVSVIRHFGFYSVLPGRIRDVIESDGPTQRYGFSFLTLEGHSERGVERFVVSWDEQTDIVRYDATAISRPAGVARLGTPVVRLLQRRFQRDSIANMRRMTTGC